MKDCNSDSWVPSGGVYGRDSGYEGLPPPNYLPESPSATGCLPQINLYNLDSGLPATCIGDCFNPEGINPPSEYLCYINPQFYSLQPVVLPPGYVAIGASLVQWNCPDYPSASSGATPNNVMGLSLIASQITPNPDGNLLFGPEATFNNAGYCGTYNVFSDPGYTYCNTYSNSACFYPPSGVPLGTESPPGFNQADYVAIYGSWSSDSGSGCFEDSAYYYADVNGAPNTQGFVIGASFWLKGNRLSIGLITSPTVLASTVSE